MHSIQRTNEEIAAAYARHADTVYRVCMLFFRGKKPDAEDAVQTTFEKYMYDGTPFQSDGHEKAWLIVTAGNVCKNVLTSVWRRRVEMNESAVQRRAAADERDDILAYVMALPEKNKLAVYMYYYEGYSCQEIARYMGKTENSVWGYLHKGRKLIKQSLKEEM